MREKRAEGQPEAHSRMSGHVGLIGSFAWAER
jgi:hypothetical protein